MSEEIKELLVKEQENINELIKITIKITDLKRDFAQNVWSIGAELNKVRGQKLFLYKYPTFLDYLDKDVGFSQSSAYSFMKMASEYDFQTFGKLGSSKCGVLITLDPEERVKFERKYTEPIIQSMPVRQFATEVRKFKKEERDFENDVSEDVQYFIEMWDLMRQILNKIDEIGDLKLKLKDYWDSCNSVRKVAFNEYKHKDDLIDKYKKIKEGI